jgi:hypothetical protein
MATRPAGIATGNSSGFDNGRFGIMVLLSAEKYDERTGVDAIKPFHAFREHQRLDSTLPTKWGFDMLQLCLLSSEEFLLLQTPVTDATGASKSQLGTACDAFRQMVLGQLGKGTNEYRTTVQRLDPLDSVESGLSNDLLVQLVQSLDVI